MVAVIIQAPVQLFPLRLREWKRLCVGCDAVPNVFDKLNALRKTELENVG